MYEMKRKPTQEEKERAKRNPTPTPYYRDGDWDHRSGREDTWREYERERPQPGPSGLS